jgi:RNA recognition motif-containing protein
MGSSSFKRLTLYKILNREDMNLLVRNLDRRTTEQELNDLFSEVGQVDTCTIVMDKVTGGSKGFGFVTMSDDSQAKEAIKKLNGTVVGANTIRVKQAQDNQA